MNVYTLPKLLFVIDTNEYAGNFERELCAYVTGTVGDCNVGSDMVELFTAEVDESIAEDLVDMITCHPDDHGCMRPASIHRSKDGKMHSVSIAFEERPSDEIVSLMKERAVKYGKLVTDNKWKTMFEVTGFRWIEFTVTETERTA